MSHQSNNYAYINKANLGFIITLWAHIPLSILTSYLASTSMTFAFVVSLAICSGPSLIYFLKSSPRLTAISIGVAIMSFSALLIHLANGMTEMHFHIFCFLGLLIVLAEPWAVIAGLLVVVVHHVGFFFFLPKSLINYDAGFGVLVIHALFALVTGVSSALIAKGFKIYLATVSKIIVDAKKVSLTLYNAAKETEIISKNLSSSTSVESSAMEQTSSAIEELITIINKNSDNANSTSDKSQNCLVKSGEGQRVVSQLVQSLEEISSSNTQINEVMNENKNHFAEINSIVGKIAEKTTVINEIVFQTKLLSFNASVEAARAGDSGKGFAVVAEEVGNLAVMSGKAAQEIAILIQESKNQVDRMTKETSEKMEKIISNSVNRVGEGVHLAEKSQDLLTDINSEINIMAQMASDISAASKEQAIGVSEINKAIQNVEAATQENSKLSSEANNMSVSLTKDSETLKEIVETLSFVIDGQKQNDKKPAA
jgi:methyl-accepting chemotaxis protein